MAGGLGADFVGAVEAIKDAGEVGGRDADPSVFDDEGGGVIGSERLDKHLAAGLIVADGIHEEIHHD